MSPAAAWFVQEAAEQRRSPGDSPVVCGKIWRREEVKSYEYERNRHFRLAERH